MSQKKQAELEDQPEDISENQAEDQAEDRPEDQSNYDESDNRSNTTPFTWSCPICFESLGSEGMIPVALSSCRFSVHLICLECYEGIQASGRTQVCPICRDPIVGKVLPITDLVNPSDQTAQSRLMSRFPHEADPNGLPPTLALLKSRVVDGMTQTYFTERTKIIENLRNNRIQTVVNQIDSVLRMGKDPGTSWILKIDRIPSFESNELNFCMKDKKRDRMTRLNDMYQKVRPDLAKIFADSTIRVGLKSYSEEEINNSKTQIHYMRIEITLPTIQQ